GRLPGFLTPADGDDDFQRVAVCQWRLGVRAARHDLAVAFHGNALSLVTQLFNQAQYGQAWVKLAFLTIQGDIHISSRFKVADWDDSIAKTVRGGQQMCQYARFVEGMAAVVDQVEAGIRPCLVQLPRGARGRAGVVAALDDGAWNAAQPMRVAQQ